ncbi:MAG: DNA polymerase III subunit delta, partial [Alphaproteobacteria bacterium]|nr:DNA polymerase III subunit delta [Alphaproteobacteria bacterium]
MKAKPFQIPALQREIKKSYKGALVYGPDFGSVLDIAEQIAKMITPNLKDDFCVIRLNPAKIKEKKTVVLDEANALSLMGGRRIVWIKEADNSCAFVVEEVLEQIKTDTFILMTADNLTKASALRVAAENRADFLCIACYMDDEKDVQAMIMEILQSNGLRSSPQAMTILKERLGENRLTTRQELEKLITYMGDIKNIEEEDVRAIITHTGTSSYDDLCMAVAGGKQQQADASYQLLLASGETAVGVVRVLIGYFNKLLLAVHAIDKGEAVPIAVKRVLRSAQFKLEADVRRQLGIWKKGNLIKVLNLLVETEKQTKTTGYPA